MTLRVAGGRAGAFGHYAGRLGAGQATPLAPRHAGAVSGLCAAGTTEPSVGPAADPCRAWVGSRLRFEFRKLARNVDGQSLTHAGEVVVPVLARHINLGRLVTLLLVGDWANSNRRRIQLDRRQDLALVVEDDVKFRCPLLASGLGSRRRQSGTALRGETLVRCSG